MAEETCPLCEGQGKGLPGYYGTMADMFTLLFAFFVLMFSLATMDPAKLSDLGGDDIGSSPEEIDEMVEEVKKQMEELKEQGITDIDNQPIEEYMDSLIQKIIDENKPVPKIYEIEEDLVEIIEEMKLDSSEANLTRDVRGTAIELYGDFCFESLSANSSIDSSSESYILFRRMSNATSRITTKILKTVINALLVKMPLMSSIKVVDPGTGSGVSGSIAAAMVWAISSSASRAASTIDS